MFSKLDCESDSKKNTICNILNCEKFLLILLDIVDFHSTQRRVQENLSPLNSYKYAVLGFKVLSIMTISIID